MGKTVQPLQKEKKACHSLKEHIICNLSCQTSKLGLDYFEINWWWLVFMRKEQIKMINVMHSAEIE